MMKHLSYITSLLLMLLCSCSDDVMPDTPRADVPDGTPIEIMASAEFPDLNLGPATRGLGEEPTEDELLNSLKVNILVFDGAGIMLQHIPPTDIAIQSVDNETKTVHFRVKNIYSSSLPRRLHFVVSSKDIRTMQGGELISSMANETTVMPALVSEGDNDVYWGLSKLDDGITNNMKLEMKVIRNFVKLTVSTAAEIDPNKFTMLGYTVVNRPNKGTVAPYLYSSHSFVSFLKTGTGGTTLKSYDEIVNEGYHGVNPAGSETGMTYTGLTEVEASLNESQALLAAGNDSPYYFYERSQSEIAAAGTSTALTYIIVKGRFNGTVYYYKVDIGNNVEGDFKFYDLLRNFHYTITLTEVGGPGAATLQEAMDGPAHNNIATSVVTRDLFAISYHQEIIEVSETRTIFTEKATGYQLQFRYTVPDGLGYEFNPANLKLYDMGVESNVHYDMSGLVNEGDSTQIELGGEVVQSATLKKGTDGWYILEITTNDIPTDARRWEQTLRVYYSGGTTNLSRTMTLMLRRPWQFTNVTSTEPTSGTGLNAEYKLTFTLPSGLVSSQFPLTLTFESDKQNIYAKKGTDLHVTVGQSGFKGGTKDNIMLYEWNMTWGQYSELFAETNPNPGVCTVEFLTNTTSTDDENYNTSGIDAAANGDRTKNNRTHTFCIRIANKGQKCIEPYYVNITRK